MRRTTPQLRPTPSPDNTAIQMTRRRARNTRGANNSTNKLIHPANVQADPSTFTDVIAPDFGIIATRPGRLRMVEVQYSSQQPRSFIVSAFSLNDISEEVYRSKTILAGPIPRTMRFMVPASTDFGIGNSTTVVIRFEHSSNTNLRFVINAHVEYKFQTPTSNF